MANISVSAKESFGVSSEHRYRRLEVPANRKSTTSLILESFRGGLTSDFTVAIYDELDEYLGYIKPVKTYNLAFVLHGTQYKELSKQQFTELVQRKHPTQANEWLVNLEQQRNLLGYLPVYGLIDGKANEMYFEVRKSLIDNQFHQVLHLQEIDHWRKQCATAPR